MKKLIITISLIMTVCLPTIMAQEAMFKKGEVVANGSIGFGSVLFSGLGYATTIPPIAASIEYGVLDHVLDKGTVGVGAYAGYSAFKFQYLNWGYHYNNIILGARGALHYPLVARLDTYTGLLVGFNLRTTSSFGIPGTTAPLGSGPAWSWFLGGRYYFNRDFAALAEIGYGIAWLNIGISYRIN